MGLDHIKWENCYPKYNTCEKKKLINFFISKLLFVFFSHLPANPPAVTTIAFGLSDEEFEKSEVLERRWQKTS